MGKAVVLIFFLLGFVIFLVVKLATRGVKEAYRAVNDDSRLESSPNRQFHAPDDDDGVVALLVGIASSTLSMQAMLLSDGNGGLRASGKDDWSIGYVAGYVDGLLQAKGMQDDGSCLAVRAMTFCSVFGEAVGKAFLRRFMDLQSVADDQLVAGMQTGRKEVSTWLFNQNKVPMGWVSHAQKA